VKAIISTSSSVTYNDGKDIPTAVKLAQASDIAIVVVAATSHEGVHTRLVILIFTHCF
jgi:hypothetical protein